MTKSGRSLPCEGAEPSPQHVDEVEHEADEAADQRAVDADILEIAADRAFEAQRDRLRVPAAHRLRDELDDAVAIGGGGAGDGAAGELVDRALQTRVLLQRLAQL